MTKSTATHCLSEDYQQGGDQQLTKTWQSDQNDGNSVSGPRGK